MVSFFAREKSISEREMGDIIKIMENEMKNRTLKMDPLIIYTAKTAVYLTVFWFVYWIIIISRKPTNSLANLKLLIIIPVLASVLLAFSTCTEQKPIWSP